MTKQWENEIPLFNRYGSKVYLKHKEDNIYYLRGDKDALIAVGVNYYPDNLDNIMSVDPSGGPYISVGTEIIKDYIVESIECIKGEGFKIKFKE